MGTNSVSISIQSREGSQYADALSQLSQPTTVSKELCILGDLVGDLVHLVDHLTAMTASSANIMDWTNKDEVLSKVKRFLLLGWPNTLHSVTNSNHLPPGKMRTVYKMGVFSGEHG